MSEYYTSGELARRCFVSVRTVQYYDREGILKAVKRDDGGRRLYSQEEVKLLLFILQCKELGLSLEEIRQVLTQEGEEHPLRKLLEEQKKQNQQKIQELNRNNDRLNCLLKEWQKDTPAIEQMLDIEELLAQKHTRDNRLLNVLLLLYVIYLFLGVPFLSVTLHSMVLPLGIAVLFLIVLIVLHAKRNAYSCPTCGRRFKISSMRDLFSINGGKKGKYLHCPYCEYQGWFKETHL